MLQSFKLALKSIWSNKVRSALTMFGIIIGVSSVIILVSLMNGYLNSQISQWGGSRREQYQRVGHQSAEPFGHDGRDVCLSR